MSDSGEPSSKRRHTDMDDIPPSMQFFKWAQLGKRSAEAINEIRSLVWNCKSKEASDILYMFMKYYDSQMQKDKEYKEKMKKRKETGENKNSNGMAVSSGHSKKSKDENTHQEESEVQFLMERRSEILREMSEDTGEEKVDDSEMEATEDVTGEDVIIDETVEPEAVVSSPDRPPTPVTPVIHSISQLPVTQPAPKTVFIKQELAEDKADPTNYSVPYETQIPADTTAVPVSRGILKKPKPEPIETSRMASSSAEEPTSPTVSTVAVADEPLTSPPAKMLKMVKRPAEALRPKLPSAPANLMPPAHTTPLPLAKHDHCSRAAATTVPNSLKNPSEVSSATLQHQKNQPDADTVQAQPRSPPLLSATEKDEQPETSPDQSNPRRSVSYEQYKLRRQQQQALPMEAHNPRKRVVQQCKPQDSITLESAQPKHSLTTKKETPALSPSVHYDPVAVAILSNNLVALNRQVNYVNEIKELAQSVNPEHAPEYNSISVEKFADPGNTFTLKYFRTLIIYLSKTVDKINTKLSLSEQSLSSFHLQIRLRAVKAEIDGIWERVRAAIDVHQVKKKAAYAQRVAVARIEKGNGASSSSQQSMRRQSLLKRAHVDSSSAQTSQWVHPSKLPKKALLKTPSASSTTNEHASCSGQIAGTVKVHDSCAFCGDLHDSINCTKYTTYDERENMRWLLKLCWHCLGPFSIHHQCEERGKSCSHCGLHSSHAALCRKLLKARRGEQRNPSQSIFSGQQERSDIEEESSDDDEEFSPHQASSPCPRDQQSTDGRTIEEEEEESDDGAEFSPQATPMHEEEVETDGDEKPIDTSDSDSD